MNKKVLLAGLSAASVAALAFGGAGPASAELRPGNIVSTVCLQLPASVAGLTSQFAGAQAAATAAAGDVGTKQSSLGTATTGLANAVVAYIKAADKGDNLTSSAQALNAAGSVFAEKAVAENNAMTASFDAQRSLYIASLNGGFFGAINTGLCTAPASTTTSTTPTSTTTSTTPTSTTSTTKAS